MGTRIEVKVRYLGDFADATGSDEERCELAVPLVSALIDHLLENNGERFRTLLIDPSTGTLRGSATLLVNGRRPGLQHELSDGDEVTLLTPVAGG